MISGVSKNYTFRKVDFSIFPTLSTPNVPASAGIGHPSMVTGHSKVAQNFLKALLTPLGHYKADPTYGSELYSMLFTGGLVYPDQLPNVFAMEAARVTEKMRSLRTNCPADEIIERAELQSVNVTPGNVSLLIYLYFRGEETPKSIVLPIRLKSV